MVKFMAKIMEKIVKFNFNFLDCFRVLDHILINLNQVNHSHRKNGKIHGKNSQITVCDQNLLLHYQPAKLAACAR